MAPRSPFWPGKQEAQVTKLTNYANKLPGYTGTVGLTNPQETNSVADAKWLAYLLGVWLPAVREFTEAATQAVRDAQTGDGLSAAVLPTFTAPALPAGVVATNTGALSRWLDTAQIIKANPGTLEATISDLGLFGDAITGPDETVAPEFTAKALTNKVRLDWVWGKWRKFFDMVEIQVDRGTGWQLLAYDTTPGYEDTTAFPAQLTKWKYRMIFRIGDERFGAWSAEASVTVGG